MALAFKEDFCFGRWKLSGCSRGCGTCRAPAAQGSHSQSPAQCPGHEQGRQGGSPRPWACPRGWKQAELHQSISLVLRPESGPWRGTRLRHTPGWPSRSMGRELTGDQIPVFLLWKKVTNAPSHETGMLLKPWPNESLTHLNVLERLRFSCWPKCVYSTMQQALISVLPIGRRESRRFKQRLTTIRGSV